MCLLETLQHGSTLRFFFPHCSVDAYLFPERFSMRQNLIKNLIKIALLHTTKSYKGRSSTVMLSTLHSLSLSLMLYKRVCPIVSGKSSPRSLRGTSCGWGRAVQVLLALFILAFLCVCFIREVSAEFWCNQQATTDPEFSYRYTLAAPCGPHLSGRSCFIFMTQSNP